MGDGNVENARRSIPDEESPLCAAPDVHSAVLIPEGRGVLRLDIPLVDRRGAELAFDHDFGLGEALLDIPQLVLDVGRDVVYPVGLPTKIFGLEVFVQQRRPPAHRIGRRENAWQHLVLDPDEA